MENDNNINDESSSSLSEMSSSDSDGDEIMEFLDEPVASTTGFIPRSILSTSSSSSSDSSQDLNVAVSWLDGESSASSSTSSSSHEEDSNAMLRKLEVFKKPKSKHNWFVHKELRERECGFKKTPQSFTHPYYGSLHTVQRLELMAKLEKHSSCVNSVNFNQSGTRLISGSDDKTVVVWDWNREKCLTVIKTGHKSNIFNCKYLSLLGDLYIVTCSRDGQVRLATSDSSGRYIYHRKLAQHNRPSHKLTLIPQSPHIILSCGEDSKVFSIDVRDPQPTLLAEVKEGNGKIPLYSIHANPMSGNDFCVSGSDINIRLYDRRKINSNGNTDIKYKPNTIKKANSAFVTCAVYSYNGAEVLGSYSDDDIYLFDVRGGETEYVHRYEGHRNAETVKGVNFFGPKSEYIVSGSDCGHIFIWDRNSEAIVQWMRGDEDGSINCLEPHPSMPVLATSGLDPDVKIWVPSSDTEPVMEGLQKATLINELCKYNKPAIDIDHSLKNINLIK